MFCFATVADKSKRNPPSSVCLQGQQRQMERVVTKWRNTTSVTWRGSWRSYGKRDLNRRSASALRRRPMSAGSAFYEAAAANQDRRKSLGHRWQILPRPSAPEGARTRRRGWPILRMMLFPCGFSSRNGVHLPSWAVFLSSTSAFLDSLVRIGASPYLQAPSFLLSSGDETSTERGPCASGHTRTEIRARPERWGELGVSK